MGTKTNSPQRVKRTRERTFSAHHILLRTARRALERAEADEEGSMLEALTALTFAALAVEAICNSIGETVIPDWKDFESATPIAKSRLIAEHLEVTYDKAGNPWQTVRWLVGFRSKIAHAKLEVVTEEKILTQAEAEQQRFDIPESKLEKDITVKNASRAVAAVENFMDMLVAKVPEELRIGLRADGFESTISLHPPLGAGN